MYYVYLLLKRKKEITVFSYTTICNTVLHVYGAINYKKNTII